MRFFGKITVLSALLAITTGSLLQAQYEFKSSWIMAEEGRAQQIFFGARTLIGIDIEYSNLGSIPYIQDDDSIYTYEFNDGYINIRNPEADFTTDFGFRFSNATEGPDNNVESFSLTRYRAESRGDSHESSFNGSTGWELGSRYDMWKLSNRVTLGFTVAGGFTPLRNTYTTTTYGNLYQQTVTVPLSGIGIPYQEDDVYTGGPYGGPYIRLEDIVFDPDFEELVSQKLAGGEIILVDSEVLGTYQLIGGMGTIRTGTYLDIYLTEKLMLHLGVGISASYLSFDFSVDQDLISSIVSYGASDEINEGEWLLGAYAELNLVYRLNQRTSLYAGAQSHIMQKLDKREVSNTTMEIKMGMPTQLQAGFEFDF